jgi:quinol monooxygenase YgiN
VQGKLTDLLITAKATAKKGQEAELERALREVVAPTRAQHGCVEFVLIRSKDDPATIIGLERWASAADHEMHLQGEHVKTLMQRLGSILAKPPEILAHQVIDG